MITTIITINISLYKIKRNTHIGKYNVNKYKGNLVAFSICELKIFWDFKTTISYFLFVHASILIGKCMMNTTPL